MENAILLGIPAAYVARLRAALTSCSEPEDWSLKFVPAPKKAPEVTRGIIHLASRLADEVANSHIFGFSTQKDRAERVKELAQCFRFRWCDELVRRLNHLATTDPTPFLQRLVSELAEEKIWSSHVKPSTIGSPLLLPESSFSAGGSHRDMWRHARAYGDSLNIEGAAKAVHEFERVYLRKTEHYRWTDDRDLVFGRDGPRHGDAPFPRGWKFSYRLPDGFHYDVTHLDQRPLHLHGCAWDAPLIGRERLH